MGSNGNGGGRPKGTIVSSETRKAQQAAAKDAFEKLVKFTDGKLKLTDAQSRTAMYLVDRGWGKPSQTIEHAGFGGVPLVTPVVNVRIASTSND